MKFGAYILECRDYAMLTQEELVKALIEFDASFESLTINVLSRWERCVNNPSDKKKTTIILFFQQINKVIYPYLEGLGVDRIRQELDKPSINNELVFSNQMILNFPNNILPPENFKVTEIRNAAHLEDLIDVLHPLFLCITKQKLDLDKITFTKWISHPTNLSLIVTSGGQFMGVFISLRLKCDVFTTLMNFDKKLNDVTEDDFADLNELSSGFPLFFYAFNTESAAYLIGRYYIRLIDKQSVIKEIGTTVVRNDAKKLARQLNLDHFKSCEEIHSYKAPIGQVLSGGLLLKMLF